MANGLEGCRSCRDYKSRITDYKNRVLGGEVSILGEIEDTYRSMVRDGFKYDPKTRERAVVTCAAQCPQTLSIYFPEGVNAEFDDFKTVKALMEKTPPEKMSERLKASVNLMHVQIIQALLMGALAPGVGDQILIDYIMGQRGTEDAEE